MNIGRMNFVVDVSLNCVDRVFLMLAAAPVVSAASSNTPLSGGGEVTVTGLSFASMEFSATTMLSSASCSTASWSSTTSVSCVSVSASLLHSMAGFTVVAVAGTGTFVFTFDGTS